MIPLLKDCFASLTILACERDVLENLNIEDVVYINLTRCPVL